MMTPDDADSSDDYDEAEETDTFPDAEEDEYADEEEEIEEELGVEYSPSRLAKFLEDPWPRVTFVMMILGFVVVLFTPNDVWRVWNWMIVGMYFLWILTAVASTIGLTVWKNPAVSRIKYGGITNAFLALVCGVLGTIDTIMLIGGTGGLLPAIDVPVLYAAILIVVFSLYSLWLVQRVVQTEMEQANQ
ncbi:MAG: hypothetical protein DRO73_05575 [Candidatus Thorarchaeota archaeon]|nr:MAG: hypothetical protein DRO73_05575 [Candidatus Thorarchaeota archaeon]RLI60429.1 MAG: hypothetical protein DRO93_07045 [Candidatus Thorarchaeota archaeon]